MSIENGTQLGRSRLASWSVLSVHHPRWLLPSWPPRWDQRRAIVAALREAGGRPMPSVGRPALAALPNGERLAAEIAGLAAGVSLEHGRSYFRGGLAHEAES